jgi:hypothetical protein
MIEHLNSTTKVLGLISNTILKSKRKKDFENHNFKPNGPCELQTVLTLFLHGSPLLLGNKNSGGEKG